MDPKKPLAGQPGLPKKPEDDLGLNSTVDEFFTRLQSDMRHPSPSQESIAAAMQTMQRLAAEASGNPAAESAFPAPGAPVCETCGHPNRPGNQFCGMCGLPLVLSAPADPAPGSFPATSASAVQRLAQRASPLPSPLSPSLLHARSRRLRGDGCTCSFDRCTQPDAPKSSRRRHHESRGDGGAQNYPGLGVCLQFQATR